MRFEPYETPETKWTALVKTMDGFLKKNLGEKHKKIRNHLVRIKNMASNSLPLPGARSPNCLTVEESKPFLRKEASKMRKLKQQEKRMVRMELQVIKNVRRLTMTHFCFKDQRKERKAQKQLFDDDFQEEMIRKKRSDDFPDDDYYDYENYPEYILTDGNFKFYISRIREKNKFNSVQDYLKLSEKCYYLNF